MINHIHWFAYAVAILFFRCKLAISFQHKITPLEKAIKVVITKSNTLINTGDANETKFALFLLKSGSSFMISFETYLLSS